MSNEIEQATMPLPEITKENIEACADAYALGMTKEVQSTFRDHYVKGIKGNWYAGFLAHANLLEPYNEDLIGKMDAILQSAEKARELMCIVEKYDFKCEGGNLTTCLEFQEIKSLLRA
jgi:hypothetical protein